MAGAVLYRREEGGRGLGAWGGMGCRRHLVMPLMRTGRESCAWHVMEKVNRRRGGMERPGRGGKFEMPFLRLGPGCALSAIGKKAPRDPHHPRQAPGPRAGRRARRSRAALSIFARNYRAHCAR